MLDYGGEGGIRTPDTVARMPHFECGAFNHSATSPRAAARIRQSLASSSHGRRAQACAAAASPSRAPLPDAPELDEIAGGAHVEGSLIHGRAQRHGNAAAGVLPDLRKAAKSIR